MKPKKISARSEFYIHKDRIMYLYEKNNLKFASEIYELLDLNMSYWSFNEYFKKEIKSKEDKKGEPVQKQTKEPVDEKKDPAIKPSTKEIDPSREEELRRRLAEDLADDRYEQAERIAKKLREENPERYND